MAAGTTGNLPKMRYWLSSPLTGACTASKSGMAKSDQPVSIALSVGMADEVGVALGGTGVGVPNEGCALAVGAMVGVGVPKEGCVLLKGG